MAASERMNDPTAELTTPIQEAPVSADARQRNDASKPAQSTPPIWQTTQRRDPKQQGLRISRRHTRAGVHPFDEVAWELRDAVIQGEGGRTVFEQRNVEFPKAWSPTATVVVASKYFRGTLGTEGRERSVRQLLGRVAETVRSWGETAGYFATAEDAEAFGAELTWLLLHQRASFNSPVWFNVGVDEKPQCSACFINSVQDSMDSILKLAHTEGMLFKGGSGAGSNLSSIRSEREMLAGGGTASGPVSFMRGFDAFAGVIKSGGKTRRAAKMVILDADHPDIRSFVDSKAHEERKAWALIDAGYDGSFHGEAYKSVSFQNANHSVRVTDAFMEAVERDGPWTTRARRDGKVVDMFPARELMREISEAAWLCGDPGLQFDTTINAWHTCPATDKIRASNPCSEYMFLDDSACNLASLNLLAFADAQGELDIEDLRAAIALLLTAQEILVDFSSYPTELIAANSHRFRPLGLGYANIGALLMCRGLPYDSEAGRHYAAAVTALMHGEAALQSARIAATIGAFPGYDDNREATMAVMRKHRAALSAIDPVHVPLDLFGASRRVWDAVLQEGEQSGFRNAQLTVLAPTGTIAFMMDCDTTGIEPDIALVKYKKLVGGGSLKIVNHQVGRGLRRLGYSEAEVQAIEAFIDEHDTIEGAPGLRNEHLAVFDCAFRAPNGSRSIEPMGHLRMMAAVQPFLSGAISKTVNLPSDATVQDVEHTYIAAWKLGVKAVAIYRDGSKRIQPLSTRKGKEGDTGTTTADLAAANAASTAVAMAQAASASPHPVRRKLPDERAAITHKFSIAGHEGYVTVGLYEDGSPGELFVVIAKEGSTISGLLDAFATTVIMALQYGVPLTVLTDKLSHTRYEPSGFTSHPDIRFAKSITDYIFRWLALKFLDGGRVGIALAPMAVVNSEAGATAKAEVAPIAQLALRLDAPPCHNCGTLMTINGSCHKCPNCGETSGCS